MKHIIGLMAMLLPILCGAQSPPVKPLTIGDTVPDIVFNHVINYKDTTARLSDFKGKLVILDFMSTGCFSCILSLPRMDSLHRKYGDQLQIFIVTAEKEDRVKQFLKANPVAKQISLPAIIRDTALKNLFPHTYISHLAWIEDGIVKAITHAEYVTAENVQKIFNGEMVKWPVKKDITNYDYSQPLMVLNSQQIPDGNAPVIQFQSTFTSHMDNVNQRAGSVIDPVSGTVRIYMFNYSLVKMILRAYGLSATFPISHMILNVKDTGRLVFKHTIGYKDDWKRLNTFCYEAIVPISMDSIRQAEKIREDIGFQFGIKITREKKMVKCWVLKASGYNSIGFKTFPNYRAATTENYISLDRIVYELNHSTYGHPIINETSFSSRNYLRNSFPDWDIPSVQKELAPYGMELKEEVREVEMLVLTETGK